MLLLCGYVSWGIEEEHLAYRLSVFTFLHTNGNWKFIIIALNRVLGKLCTRRITRTQRCHGGFWVRVTSDVVIKYWGLDKQNE